jgi:hypothetical protein
MSSKIANSADSDQQPRQWRGGWSGATLHAMFACYVIYIYSTPGCTILEACRLGFGFAETVAKQFSSEKGMVLFVQRNHRYLLSYMASVKQASNGKTRGPWGPVLYWLSSFDHFQIKACMYEQQKEDE